MEMLRKLRKEKGLSMKKLGAIIGVAESTISLYESGKREPDYKTLLTLALFFNVSTDYLLQNIDGVNFVENDRTQLLLKISDLERENKYLRQRLLEKCFKGE